MMNVIHTLICLLGDDGKTVVKEDTRKSKEMCVREVDEIRYLLFSLLLPFVEACRGHETALCVSKVWFLEQTFKTSIYHFLVSPEWGVAP